ncbi:hypothetical protein O9X98_09365 [Agrobacterium salinitolerans]|nr:hypothetical protein [Agrobacterium salinitolerans]
MFQLIVAVIAIALVIALTLASIFYGGEAFTRSSLKANVAAMVNQAQQISGAHTLYKTDFAVDAPSLAALETEGYLAEIPNAPKIVKQDAGESVAWVYEPANDRVYIELGADSDETCTAVNANGAGFCSDGSATAVKGDAGITHYQFPL